MIGAQLTPIMTLAEVYGPGVVYVPRRSPNLPGWSPPLPGQVDFLTGVHLGIAGGMPYVVCGATITPAALEVRAEAGLAVDAELHTYRSVSEYLPLLARLLERGYRLATQRVHPEDEVPGHASVPPAALLSQLNDKGEAESFVPNGWLPARRTLAATEVPDAQTLLVDGRPIVLKAATRKPSGGGHGIWICRTGTQVESARADIGGQERVVLEEFVDIETTFCVHGVVHPDGRSELIGSAEEMVRDGYWLGNWHDEREAEVPPHVLAVVRGIVEKASALGYRGITGVDVARLVDGSWRVLDLNFRINGSTAAAWLRQSIERVRGSKVMQSRGWACAGGFDKMIGVVRNAVRRGTLVPLGLYDPEAGDMGGIARASGLLHGNSRAEIDEENRRLHMEGLT